MMIMMIILVTGNAYPVSPGLKREERKAGIIPTLSTPHIPYSPIQTLCLMPVPLNLRHPGEGGGDKNKNRV